MRSHWRQGMLLAALLLVGCPAQWRYEDDLARTPTPAAHAVHERRLSELMRGLDRLRTERLPQALDLHSEEQRQAREIARVAAAMAESAGQIPAAASERVTAAERPELQALAAELERQALQLAAEAANLSPEQRRAGAEQIEAICERCHHRFGIPGLEPPAR